MDFQNNYIVIYFHGNGEDIFHSLTLTQFLAEYLNMKVLAVEYPGYSVYGQVNKEIMKNTNKYT